MHLPSGDGTQEASHFAPNGSHKTNGVDGTNGSHDSRRANGTNGTNGATANGPVDTPDDRVLFKRALTGPQSTENPVDLLLLAWLLVLYRFSGGTPGLFDFTWGFLQGSEAPRTFSEQVTLDGSESTTKLLEIIRSLRNREGPPADRPWQEGTSLFFNNGAVPEGTDTPDADPNWSYQIEATLISEHLSLTPRWRTPLTARYQAFTYARSFNEVLNSLLDDLNQPASNFLQPSERELDELWRMNEIVPPNIERCIHDLITERWGNDPNRPAVNSWDGDFTYGEVETLSTQLAHHLRSIGVGIGSRVPLCFEKSRWTVVGVLAIMKSGAGFVLTDPSQPEGRLQTIVEQTGATVVLVSKRQHELGKRVAPNATVIVVSQDTFEPWTNQTLGPLPPVPASETLYVIFTSGSTGKPKGVVLTHANYTSGALPRADVVGYRAHSRVLDFASYAFDVSIDCMLATLVQGGCICVPSEEDRVNDLSGAIRKMNVNMAHMTPSVARVLDPDILPSLEILGLGGEYVPPHDANNWGQHTKIVIAYGPSECTVGCTMNNNVGVGKAYTTIGKGCGGTTWVVDPENHNRLVPPGAVGELLIEGPIVGVGYLGEPEKTAAVFIEDPTWLVAGSKSVPGRHGRLYKTGDLVKFDPNGSGEIFFVGRGDQQVKLRGQRVELAEIEHHLRLNLPQGTGIAAEVIKPGGKGEPTLVAFLAEQKDKADDDAGSKDDILGSFSDEFRQRLPDVEKAISTKLPIYMIPSAYIPLKKVPLLVSCKTDRKRLREIGANMSRQELARLRVAVVEKKEPQTEMERALQRLWTQILGADVEAGTGDSFFALGGDSLKAMRLVAAARAEGIELTVANIFSRPTLAEMAASAVKAEGDIVKAVPEFSLLGIDWEVDAARAEVAKLCSVDAASIEDVYPCTPLQEALMALSAKVSEAYVAQRVVKLADSAAAEKLKAAFQQAAAESPILRTRIVQVPGHGLMQVVVKNNDSWHSADDLKAYLVRDREDPMELGKPLVRYAVVKDAATDEVHFVLTIHHALYDGWSMPLVVDRVNRAYKGLSTKRPAEFKHFIKYLVGLDRQASESYWREQLRGADGPQFPTLPYTGYQTQADSLLEHYVTIPQRSASTTLATAIRGAWALVASQYTASEDVVFGETLTGRNAPVPGVEEIEGPMIATVPIRVAVSRSTKISDYLQDIHNQTVLRIPHEHTGLQNIRRLSPDAREACELRTGLVLHPSTEAEDIPTEDLPANSFVPAGDAEAAREALKFNTYALMLVCSLDPQGFLIMASFDSNTVDSPQMERILNQFGRVVQQLCDGSSNIIGEIESLTEEDRSELVRLSTVGPESVKKWDRSVTGEAYPDVTATWIVDPTNPDRLLPRGAVGELFVEGSTLSSNQAIDTPRWRAAISGDACIYKTGKLARYDDKGTVVFKGRMDETVKQAPKTETAQKTNKLSVTSEKQRKLRQLWSHTIGIDEEEIGLNDSFFQLGGDSIGAMKLVSEARLEGYHLTVAQVFQHRCLYDMANILQDTQPSQDKKDSEAVTPFAVLDVPDASAFVAAHIQPALEDKSWKVADVLPARPLQEVAVDGTIKLPRFSARYELFYFNGDVNKTRLFQSCQELVARNEILRTVFVKYAGTCYGVVLEELVASIVEYKVAGDLESFVQKLCDLDVQTEMPLGSSFVKFFFVQGENCQSCLAFRISHAQYDEICLPLCLRQLSALYEGRPVPETRPFSLFINHTIKKSIPRSIDYWRNILKGSSMSVLRPEAPVVSKKAISVYKELDISTRSKDITIATLPTAAWALVLARRLAVRDVVFGEVVSGRNTDLPHCDTVMGPCWQYIPMRVKFEPGWKVTDLLNFVQNQHIASTSYEGMGLTEIVKNCTDWPESVDWFDTVVHQDTDHVKTLEFESASSRMETVYPHLEPLREWKIQAFPDGDKITMEIVTFESWKEEAERLIKDIGDVMTMLVRNPGAELFEE